MTGELPPRRDTVDTYRIGVRTLAEWHRWLNTDRATGADEGRLATPGSRYGETSADCSWWAIAGQVALTQSSGTDENADESLEYLMGLAVNDHEDLADLVRNYEWLLPDDLLNKLDWDTLD